MRHYGLLQSRQYPRLATSNDAVMRLVSSEDAFDNIVAVELKTSVSDNSIVALRERVSSTLPGSRFFSCGAGSELFTKYVPEVDHRVQLFHHAAVNGLRHSLYVAATPTEIVYAVLAQFEVLHLWAYCSFMSHIMHSYATVDHVLGLPQSELGRARDHHTFKVTSKLSTAIQYENSRRISQNEPMLKPAHSIIPVAVAYWNHVKGGQDVVSRMLKNVKVDFRSLTPRAFIWMRLVSLCLINAHLILRLMRVSFVQYQSHLR